MAASAYETFEAAVTGREDAMGAAQTSYSTFDPADEAPPAVQAYAAPPDAATGSASRAQSAYAAPDQLNTSLTPAASVYSQAGADDKPVAPATSATPVAAPSASSDGEYKNAAPATAPSPYAVTTAAGQTEAPAKFVLKQRRDKNWNEELQELVDAPDSAAKYHQLSALIREFNFVAETFGKIIISEMSYPAAMRSVKPVSAGGQAGGEKYVHKNIFFKFAIDLHGIYGGDEHAMKAAEHDLKGLIWYSNSGVKQLHFPLMSLVDYLGYRLIALSVLPLAPGGKSLLYGSCDGGQTVNTIDPVLNALMEKAGDRMRLKKHRAGLDEATKKWISGPVDIEGHMGLDGRYYVLDYARTFPCEAFSRKDGNFVKGQHLYKLLRPELVRTNQPLSSDAFSAWGIGDRESVMEVQMATARLFNQEIPRVARLIDTLKEDALSPQDLITLVHQNGINVRHLGRLRSLTQTESYRRLMLIEMTLRVVKNEIRATLRKAIFEHPLSEEPARRAITPILNRVMAVSEDSAAYWTELKDRVCATFRFALNDQEQMHDLSILLNFEDTEVRRSVISRLQQLAGFRLIDDVARNFCKQRKWRLLPIDIAGFSTQFKSSNLMDISEALSCLYEAQDLKGAEAFRMADAALGIFRRALSKMHHLGNVENLLVLAKLFFRCSKEGALSIEDCRARAKETLDLAAELDPDQKHLYKLELGNILIQFNKYADARAYFEDVKKGQTDPALIALCDAAIVTALHLEGNTKAALELCETLVGSNMTAAPKEWLWVLGVLRFTNAAHHADQFLLVYDAAPPLLAALQAGFAPPPDGHFQLSLGSALHNTNRKLGLLCLASCHPVLANYIFSNPLLNFDGIFPLSKSPLLDEHFSRLFLGSLGAPVKEIFASLCKSVSGAALAKAVSAHQLQLFAASGTALKYEDVKVIANAACAPTLRELELDNLEIDEPILPHVAKSMTSLTALSLLGSKLDLASFREIFTQRSTLRELCLSGEGKWFQSEAAKAQAKAEADAKAQRIADAKAARDKKIEEGTPESELPVEEEEKEAPPVAWLESVVSPPEAFAATGLLILELPGFANLRTADVLALLRLCPSLERLDLTHSRGFSHLEVFNKIPDTRVSCLIAASGFPYYWSDSPLRLELSRSAMMTAVQSRTSPPVMVKHLNNQANLSIPGLILSTSMNQATVMYRELPFSRHRFETSSHIMFVQNMGVGISVKYTEAGASARDVDSIVSLNVSGPLNAVRAVSIKAASAVNSELKHMGTQPWPNGGVPLGQEKFVRGIQNSVMELPRARRPVTLLMIAFLWIEEWANTKQI